MILTPSTVGARRRDSPGYSTSPTTHARLDIVRRRAIDDHLGAAVVDVVVRRDDRDARPFEPDLDVAAWRVDSSVRMPRSTGRPAVTMIFAAPDCRSGTVCLPISLRDADLVGAVLRDLAPCPARRG